LQGNDAGETLSFHASDLTLPKHNSIHRELEVYTELMHWCKAMDRKAYTALTKVYTNSLSKLYERDIKQFFEEAKQQISGMRERKGSAFISGLYYRLLQIFKIVMSILNKQSDSGQG
jgi:hypothetical protein